MAPEAATTVLSTLIVDDNPGDVFMIRELLESSGRFEYILTARDGQEAIELFEAYEESRALHPGRFPPIVILLDINMPRMDGFTFLERFEAVRDRHSIDVATVLMLTSSDEPRDRRRAMAFDFVRSYLHKPCRLEDANAIADQYGTAPRA